MSGAGRCAERLKFRAKWEVGLRRLDLRIKLRLLPGLRAAGFCKVRDFAYCEILRDAGLCAVRDLARCGSLRGAGTLPIVFAQTSSELSMKLAKSFRRRLRRNFRRFFALRAHAVRAALLQTVFGRFRRILQRRIRVGALCFFPKNPFCRVGFQAAACGPLCELANQFCRNFFCIFPKTYC